MTTIYVEFSNTVSFAAAPWSYNLAEIANGQAVGTILADLNDDTNAATGISLSTVTAFDSAAASTGYATVDNEWVKEAYWVTWLTATSGAIRLSGIAAGSTYSIKLAGQQTNTPLRVSDYTVEGSTLVYTPSTNGAAVANPTEFTGTVAGDGVIDITVSPSSGSTYGLLSGMEITITPSTSETANTGDIPLVIQAGYTKTDLVDPITTNASLLFGYTGDAPVTGDDLEYDVTSVLDSGVTFDVAADGVWTITEAVDGDWTTNITVSRRVVQADGTIGTEAVMTFDPTEVVDPPTPPATAGSIPYAMRQMAMRLSFHSYLIQESKGRWEQDQLNAAIVALGGSAMTPPVGAPDAAVGYTGTQTYLEFYKRLQRALVYPTPIDVVPAVQAALLARGWTL